MEIDVKNVQPSVRRVDEMKKTFFDQEWAKTAPNLDLYYMYRGVEENNGIRYDITVLNPDMLGAEFLKTKGHYHTGKFPEVYTVLEGQAIYLMQKKSADDVIEDVYAVKAQPGDVVIIPPDYGHITINPSKTEKLTMANWVASACSSDYSLFEQLQGGCYYYLETGWMKNPNYKQVPELRFEEPVKEVPKDLEFLKIG